MFTGAVADFQEILYAEKNTALYNNMLQISEAMLKIYPKHVQSMLNMSTVYVRQNNLDKSIEVLIKANKAEPENAILHYNLAYVYGLKGDKANSKKYYELVVVNAKEKELQLKEAAQKHLEELK